MKNVGATLNLPIAGILLLIIAVSCDRSPVSSPSGAGISGTAGGKKGLKRPVKEQLAMEMMESALREALDVPEEILMKHSAFLKLPNTGIARILERSRFGDMDIGGIRGGGAYYSFATRSNSYNDEPDLALQGDYYGSGFYGNSRGFILDLDDTKIEEVDEAGAVVPKKLPAAVSGVWTQFFADAHTDMNRYDDTIGPELNKVGYIPRVKAAEGHTYLLRSLMPGEHDHLVVFRTVEANELGHTIIWRILKSWHVPHR